MIYRYHILNTYIVLDVYSGAVHEVDKLVYDLLGELENADTLPDAVLDKLSGSYAREEITAAFEEVKQLTEDGLLFTNDPYAALAAGWQKNSVVKAVCLHIAHGCNLKCKYCFAGEGEYHSKGLMSFEVGKQAIDFVIAHSGSRRNIEVDFFGGEPLLNFDVVKQIVHYARGQEEKYGKRFRFTITTNGLLLDEDKKAFINEHMSNIVLSLDGRPEVNDRMRPRADGGGSYNLIVDKFKDMAESRKQDNYYVRGTFTRHNLDFAEDVLHLADLGFQQLSVEPVVASAEEEYALREEDLPVIYAEYERLAKEYVKRRAEGKGFNFFHFMIDLEGGPCVVKRLSGCGAGHEYIAVTPDGDIYPCHQFVGDEAMRMGSVMDDTFDEGIKKRFEDSNIYTKPSCSDCFAKFYCSGGCPANAYKYCGDINTPLEMSCKLQRKRVECAIYCAVKLMEQE